MKYKAVIFDLDGTLLDTLNDLLDNLEDAFKSLNLKGDFTREEMESFIGSGKKAQVERALLARGYSLDLYEKLNAALTIRYELNAVNKTRPFAGVIELLEFLKAQAIPALCLTNKPHDVALEVVQNYFPNLILATYGVKPDGFVKPHPSLVETVLKTYNLNHKEVLYVGDSDIDMLTANNGKLDAVFVTWGYVRYKVVAHLKPKFVVDNPQEIVDIVKG